MFTAYTGNGAYCFTNSLHMCLRHAGMASAPDVSLLECTTGMPFGASFLKLPSPLFFPSPGSGTSPDRGLTRAIETVGWTCEVLRFEEAATAVWALREALDKGPALIGPLDMGYLPYDPIHTHKRGGDHFVVALKMVGDLVQVHDPQLYPFAMLPIADLAQAWNSRHIGYSAAAYTLRCDFRAQRSVSTEQMLAEILSTAREMIASAPAGPVSYGGPQAFTGAAEVLRGNPPDAFTGFLMHFALPLGARRCLDAASFFDRIGKPEAVHLMLGKAEAFGQAQYHAVQKDWKRTAELFDRLSSLEAQVAGAV